MKHWKPLLVLAALALVAYATVTHFGDKSYVGPMEIGPKLDTRQGPLCLAPADPVLERATEKAITVWNLWGDYPNSFIFTTGSGPGCIPIVWGEHMQIAAGWYNETKTIEVSDAYRPGVDCLRCVIAHELGHVLGIPHGADGPFGLADGPTEELVRGDGP